MPPRRISSLWTPFHKFILPALFAFSAVNVFVWGTRDLRPTGEDFPPDAVFYVMPILFLAFSLWTGWRLKQVMLDVQNRRLYVSNYRKEITIPFSDIVNVTEFLFSDPRRITIHLRGESEFGKKIVFLGTYRFGGVFAGKHPIVNELQSLADQDSGA